MAYDYPEIEKNENGNFGPTQNGHEYYPHPHHHRNANKRDGKTRWILRENEQYEVFKISDEGLWNCIDNNALFSILDEGKEIFGENEERLAFFRNPRNPNEAYHGFPIFSSEYQPSAALIQLWVGSGVINDLIALKIERGQL